MNGLATFAALCAFASPVLADDILVFAAASLKGPLDFITADYDVTVSYGGSGTLARQVSQGAPADLVILANPEWVDVLKDGGHVKEASDILSNRLVLVGQDPVALTVDDMLAALGNGRLAIGRTQSVPAGIYGKAALESLGLWSALETRLAEMDNVRAALALVARGEAPLGIVYATDVRVVPTLQIAATFPADSHPPIRYIAGVVTQDPDVIAFYDALQGEKAQAIFADAGFGPKTP